MHETSLADTLEKDVQFSGIRAATGKPFWPSSSIRDLKEMALGDRPSPSLYRRLFEWLEQARENIFDVRHGIDPCRLDQAGWGVITPTDLPWATRRALGPLLEHRRNQAGDLFRSLTYLRGESALKFLGRHHVGPGPVDPRKLPYFLLIVGSPQEIPFEVQYQLDVQYAVGRVYFDHPEAYGNYARSVIQAETGVIQRPRRACFFSPANRNDRATHRSLKSLVLPSSSAIQQWVGEASVEQDRPWEVEVVAREEAIKATLGTLLGGNEAPALLFCAAHGVGFDLGDPAQVDRQGAILCQDWPGPRKNGGAIEQQHYFAASDVSLERPPAGLIAFLFACFGAGTPRFGAFDRTPRIEIAPRDSSPAYLKSSLAIPTVEPWRWSDMWKGRGVILLIGLGRESKSRFSRARFQACWTATPSAPPWSISACGTRSWPRYCAHSGRKSISERSPISFP